MTKKEFSTLSTGLKASYPRFTFQTTEGEMEFWYLMLEDIPYEIAENAVMEHIATSTYPPSIADIRKLCAERCKAPVLSASEAWSAVQNAIFKYGWNYPQEAYKTLDEITLSVVKEMGWNRLCESEFSAADRADFKESYEAKVKAMQKACQLPKFVAENKTRLKTQYIPLAENNEQKRIEHGEPVREVITDEQRIEIARRFDEARRRILSGDERDKTGDTGN